MNISAMIVKTLPEHLEQVIEMLKAGGLCDLHFHDKTGRIIITVEGEDSGEEVKKMRDIMNLPQVISADLAYSCNEDGSPKSLDHMEILRDAVPESLRSSDGL